MLLKDTRSNAQPSAVLVDDRGQQSPVKVTAFTTPDNTKPDFASGFPYMSRVTDCDAQVTVMTTKSCKLYYALLPKGSTTPTVNELKSYSVSGALGFARKPSLRTLGSSPLTSLIKSSVSVSGSDTSPSKKIPEASGSSLLTSSMKSKPSPDA